MIIIADSRERKSYADIISRRGVGVEISGLKTGDYTIKGLENKFAIERKTLTDFISSITHKRKSFEEKVVQASKNLSFYAIVIECTLHDITNHNYSNDVAPEAILNTILCWTVKYHIPIILCESRSGGAQTVIGLAQEFLKHGIQ